MKLYELYRYDYNLYRYDVRAIHCVSSIHAHISYTDVMNVKYVCMYVCIYIILALHISYKTYIHTIAITSYKPHRHDYINTIY